MNGSSKGRWAWVVAGAVALAAAIGVWWWLRTNDAELLSPRTAKPKAVVAPELNPKAMASAKGKGAQPAAEAKGGASERPYPPAAYWPDGRLKEHTRYVKVVTNHFNKARLSFAEKVFRAGADRDIAYLLTAKPGAPIIGEIEYGEKCTKRFLKSLETPIVIEPDDPEDVAELKRAVRDTKIELKARHDAGEDIGKIMADTRKELKELSLYRSELEGLVRKMKADSHGRMTATEAANVMLKDRGAEPLSMPSMMLRSMELRDAKREQRKNEERQKN